MTSINDCNQKLKELGISEINLEDLINDNIKLGKGVNATIWKGRYKGNDVAIKIMDLYLDTPLIKTFNDNNIITQTAINDIIISFVLGKLNNKTIQKFYGYKITDDHVILVKELCAESFLDRLAKFNDCIISNLLIHILLSYWQYFKHGNHCDIKYENILIKKRNDNFVKYKIDDKIYKIKTYGYIPVLTDFGSSMLYAELNDKKMLIKRHTDWKNNNYKNNYLDKYVLTKEYINDGHKIIYNILYYRAKLNKYIKLNWIVKFYKKISANKIITFDIFFSNKQIVDYLKKNSFK